MTLIPLPRNQDTNLTLHPFKRSRPIHGPDEFLYYPRVLGVKRHTSHLRMALFFFLSHLVIYIRFLFPSCFLLADYYHTRGAYKNIGRWACFFSLLHFSANPCLSPCLSAPANFLLVQILNQENPLKSGTNVIILFMILSLCSPRSLPTTGYVGIVRSF